LIFDPRKPCSGIGPYRAIFEGLQRGKIDRSQFTGNANSYFTDQAVQDFASSLGPLGMPLSFVQTEQEDRGGMTFHAYAARFADRSLSVWVRETPDGKIEQYQVSAS
jgi:D-alanyl-D-alanine carboxypeptidase